jgi:hypothetical protein
MDSTEGLTTDERLVLARRLRAVSAQTMADAVKLLESSRRLISVAKAEVFLDRALTERVRSDT